MDRSSKYGEKGEISEETALIVSLFRIIRAASRHGGAMGRLLEIAKTAFAEIESQDTKKTETERLALNRANAAKTGRLVVEPDERICWHCDGTGQCDCMTCGRFEVVWKAGKCKPCEARRRERVQ